MVDQLNRYDDASLRGSMPPELPYEITLTENARTVLEKRYLRRNPDGTPAEDIEGMFWRVAWNVAAPEEEHGGDRMRVAEEYYRLLTSKRFFPNSPTFTGAGTPLGQLAACFVLAIEDDMGRGQDGIFQTLRNAALIQQTGGGNGFSFSRLRPKGATVYSSSGQATGPIGFLRVYDQAFGEIAQGGCLLPDTLVNTDQGLLRLDEIVTRQEPGWESHTVGVATDAGWRTSTEGYNNGVVPVVRVQTDAGLNIAGTPEHKVKVMTEEGPVWRSFEDLQPGDYILVQLGQHSGQLQALAHPAQVHGNQYMPEMPAVLDESLAFFLGYLAGDGFVAHGEQDHRVGVSVAHSSYLVDEMPALLGRLFGPGLALDRQQKPDDASVTFVIDNRAVKDFLIANGFAKGLSREVSVPRLIRQSPPKVVGAYLRGLFEADGSTSHGYPSIVSTSERLLQEVAALLIGLGCPVSLQAKPASEDRLGTAPQGRLMITSHVGLAAWRKYIGCDPRSRFQACADFDPDLQRESSYPLPMPAYWVSPVLDAVTLPQVESRARGQGLKFRSSEAALRRRLLRYVHGQRQFTRSAYQMLSDEYPVFRDMAAPINDLWFVAVTGVEPAGEQLTLDLEVEGNHTYLANGMVTHNTRRGANMAVLNVEHPDIREFITCKVSENAITNFNVSVGMSDKFMQAVKNDEMFDLVNPQDGKTWETVRARELFDLIIKHAHFNGEPGMLFLDAANRDNPVPHMYKIESTNPCVVGSARVATQDGLLKIEDMAERGHPLFVAADERTPVFENQSPDTTRRGIALRPATPAWQTRQSTPVMKLTTKGGFNITATPDHRFLTPTGYVELKNLQPGDRVLLQSGEGAWSEKYELPNAVHVREQLASMALAGDRRSGNIVQRADFSEQYQNVPARWSHELGLVLGVLVGDGWLSPRSGSPVGMVFSSDEILERIHEAMTAWFGAGHIHERSAALKQMTYGRLPLYFFQSLGVEAVPAREKRVPQSIWTAPREAVVGFLQGLFSADGTVHLKGHNDDCTIRLASSSLKLLEDVQILLGNFGIVARIYARRKAGKKLMPDGKGGMKLYAHHAQYEIIIGRVNRDKFSENIGFIDAKRQAIVEAYLSTNKKNSAQESFTDEVDQVEDAGLADVYDLTQLQTHSFIVNNFVTHNCGEQFLGPNENCCLGSINLGQHVIDGQVDWELLRESTVTSTRFLDDVVDANAYVPSVPELEAAAKRVRRIGLGIMGLGDMMYALGIRYGSEAGQEFASQVMEFIHYHCMKTSIELAKERGSFLAIRGSLYDPLDLKWRMPEPLIPHVTDWGRPALNWHTIYEGIKQHGIRNGAQTTIAPTGTISTVAGIEGYGCEPVFALAYVRYFDDNGVRRQLQYTSPQFEDALEEAGITGERRQRIISQVNLTGSCQGIKELPESIRDTFVVASDITPEEHVRMQAVLQRFVSNAISKTCNFPATATREDVAKAFMLAWELGCKGLTVYVAGSRDKVVLETAETAQSKLNTEGKAAEEEAQVAPVEVLPVVNGTAIKPKAATVKAEAKEDELRPAPLPLFTNEIKRPRARRLKGFTYRSQTPLGTTFVTVNESQEAQPFEVFIHTSKAGSETAAVSEAMGRLISYILRMNSPVAPRKRLEEIVHQLEGIGGGRALGLGPNRVRSLPDGVSQILDDYLNETGEDTAVEGSHENLSTPKPAPGQLALTIGDLCPSCGQAAIVNEEGCRKCYACSYSEC